MSWRATRIGDLGRVVTGKTPLRSRPEYFGNNFPFVTPSDFGYMHYRCNEVAEGISIEGFDKHANQTVPAGTPMCVCIGNTLGKCAISVAPSLTNQQINSLIPNEDNDAKFIYYLLCHSRGNIRAVGLGGGAAQPIINKSKFSSLEVSVPDKPAQVAIADILSAYDDLIENNRRRIALLEEAARLLYREWFVHFRFPGHEHATFIDGLPEGWERKPIEELTSLLSRGISPAYDVDAQYLVVNQKCVRNRMLTLKQARHQKREFKPEKTLQFLDVLINSTGKGTLGRVAQCWVDVTNATFDSHVTVARPNASVDPWWFGYAMTELERVFEGMGRGATNQKELATSGISATMIVVPQRSRQDDFGVFASATSRQIQKLIEQNQKLAQARDLLLPKLMSGEIAV